MGKRIALIATFPQGEQGSMARYAGLVASSLSAQGIDVRTVNLTLPMSILECVPAKFRIALHHIWILLTAPLRLWLLKADFFHIVDGSHAYVGHFLPSGRLAITAHDIIPFLLLKGELNGVKPGRLGRLIMQQSISALEHAGSVVCDSENTMKDLLEHTQVQKEKLCVIHPALSYLAASHLPDWQDRLARNEPYIFHIGHNGYYKNRRAVLQIFAGIVDDVPELKLKMAGPPPSEDLLVLTESLSISDKVDFIEYPDDQSVAELYANACLFLFPSRYEGFGWPPLEAMASGCPVVCSSAGSLAEVVGDAAIVEDVENIEMMISRSVKLLQDESLAQKYIDSGKRRIRHFDSADMAKLLLKKYKEVAT